MMKATIQGVLTVLLVCGLLAGPILAQDEEPSLPPGLEEPELPSGLDGQEQATDEPELPAGLVPEEQGLPDEPSLPSGLEEIPAPSEDEAEKIAPSLPFELSGFLEIRGGIRTQPDRYERDISLGETRLQLEIEKTWERAAINVTADFLYDTVFDHHSIHLETGQGWLDLREANFSLTPADFLDIKAGRQILTWGTGDLLFINDLFPKDWKAFFIGRDTEYLKAPSDAVKFSFYGDLANLDFVYTPRFDSDRFIDGSRLSYFSPTLGRRAGRDAIIRADKPDDWFQDDEFAARLFRNIKGYELALYGYWGFWKSPGGMNPVTGRATFPDLSTYGASIRGPLGKGIVNAEFGYYYSQDDSGGSNPFVNNSELRYLVGYEQELAKDLTIGLQYYLEQMMDYGDYQRNLPAGIPKADNLRHLVTIRLTQLLMNQNIRLSFFAYYSPSDNDAYLRPSVHYKIDDHLSVQVGANVFFGKDEHTFFSQFEKNSNIYAALRYAF